MEPDNPITMETRKGGHKKSRMIYNRSGDNFWIDKKKTDEIGADMVNLGDFVPDQEWQIIDHDESFWQEVIACQSWRRILNIAKQKRDNRQT